MAGSPAQASGAELAQVMVEMPVTEDSPVAPGHSPEHRMVGPLHASLLLDEAQEQRLEGGEVVLPDGRWRDEGLGRSLDEAPGPGQPVDHRPTHDRPPE